MYPQELWWAETVMGGTRPRAAVRAVGEAAYGLIVPDLRRPAWSGEILGMPDGFPARMRVLQEIMLRPGTLLWEVPPRPVAGAGLTPAQADLRWAIGAVAPQFQEHFSCDPIATQALAAVVMAWGARMEPALRQAALKATSLDPRSVSGGGERHRHMAELARLVAGYEDGWPQVVADVAPPRPDAGSSPWP